MCRSIYRVMGGICFLFALFWGYKALKCFCEDKTDGFTVLAISSHRPFDPAWEVHPLSSPEKEEMEQACNQKYHYLASGNQSFVFLSEDGRYVVKFFNQKLFRPHRLLEYMPKRWLSGPQEKKIWKKQDKLRRDFSSYQLAFDELKSETGLVLVHLNRSTWLQKTLTLIDKIGIAHPIDLDQFDFILQKRAELVYPHLMRLIQAGDLQGAKQALTSILELFLARTQKGIADSDPDLDKNFGFIGSQAVQIDIGRFTRFKKSKRSKKQVVAKVEPPLIKESFKAWLSASDPELFEWFEKEYAALCEAKAFCVLQDRF